MSGLVNLSIHGHKWRPAPAIERFEDKYIPEPNSGCWLWVGALSGPNGYGIFCVGKMRYRAHRYSYEYHVGPIPKGLQLDHLCRVPSCVNPDHLEPVTQRENGLRGIGAAAMCARKTHCVNGHPLSGDNVRPRQNGNWMGRQCITCEKERRRRRTIAERKALATLDVPDPKEQT